MDRVAARNSHSCRLPRLINKIPVVGGRLPSRRALCFSRLLLLFPRGRENGEIELDKTGLIPPQAT